MSNQFFLTNKYVTFCECITLNTSVKTYPNPTFII